jgi:hypothetical protein
VESSVDWGLWWVEWRENMLKRRPSDLLVGSMDGGGSSSKLMRLPGMARPSCVTLFSGVPLEE